MPGGISLKGEGTVPAGIGAVYNPGDGDGNDEGVHIGSYFLSWSDYKMMVRNVEAERKAAMAEAKEANAKASKQ